MIQIYWDQVKAGLFQDPDHAWIFLCLLYILLTLIIQTLLSAPVKRLEKRISTKNIKSIHGKYLFRSLSGWFLYFVSLGLFLIFWYSHFFHIIGNAESEYFFLAGCVTTFLLSVIFHLGAYAASCLDQIKLLEDKQLTF